MQVHFSYQHGASDAPLQKIIGTHVRKLDQLLVRFSPDLVHLHGVVEFGTPKQGTNCSLNLWLPTARLHARERGNDIPAVLRASFEHLEEQVKKHKEVLRREGEWKRTRYRSELVQAREEAGELRVQDRQQLREYLDQVLPQLKRFIERELRFQQLGGTAQPSLQQEEILDEVVARALENHRQFAEEAAPFHRLLQEVIRALNGAAPTPARESAAAEREFPPQPSVDPVDLCLALLPPRKRQVYVLHALEGFTFDEVAQVLGKLRSEVEEAFREVSLEVSTTIESNRPASAPHQAQA